MTRRAYCFAGLLLVGQSPYSCHKPTPQESYADDKLCLSAYRTGLEIIPDAQFEQARLDRSSVQDAANNSLAAAYADGKQLGLSSDAIARDLEHARRAYLAAHSGGSDAAQKMAALRSDMNNCLGDYYGRPND